VASEQALAWSGLLVVIIRPAVYPAGFVGGTNSVTISIRSDSGGTPCATLESLTVPMTGSYGTLFPPEMVTSVVHPTLAANQQYWVTRAPGA
jgi:hypothetical protein